MTPENAADVARHVDAGAIMPRYDYPGDGFVGELPAGLRTIAGVLPVKPFVDALTEAFDPRTTGLGFDGPDLLVLAAWGLAGLVLAMRFFVWTPRQQAG